ncbi:MAG: hypothetical protein K8H88_21865, partial [Sandaracinaceae bacterium]|nr:hypothetical protein [Sandaracinaceae bacterium]
MRVRVRFTIIARVSSATDTRAWRALVEHQRDIEPLHLRDLFREDPGRAARMSLRAGPLYCDYSKHRATARTLELLVELAEERGLSRAIDAMFAGEAINATEGRAVLHVALRNRSQ